MQRLVPPGELLKTLLVRLCSTVAQRLLTSYIVGEVIHFFQLLIGRSPPGLPLDGDKQLGEVSASLTSDGRHRLHIQRECYRAYLDEEMSLQQKRREMHKSRPFRVWSSGEWCWFWRSRAHLHRRTKASRQFKRGCVLGSGACTLART